MKVSVRKYKDLYKLFLVHGTGKERLQKTLPLQSDSEIELKFIAEKMNKEIKLKNINSYEAFCDNFPYLNKNDIDNILSYKEIAFVDYLYDIINNKYKLNAITSKTYSNYMNILNEHLKPYFKGIKTVNLKRRLIQDYVIEKRHLSRGTIDNHLNIIRLGVNNAINDGLLEKDITQHLDKPKSDKKERELYSCEEIEHLLSLLKEQNYELYLQVLLASSLGLRNAEILGLCWDSIDFKDNIVKIRRITSKNENNEVVLVERTKTESSNRSIQAPIEVIKELKKYKKMCMIEDNLKSNLLFHKNNKPIAQNVLSTYFSNFLKKNNLRHTRLHDLRHYFASKMIDSNVPITTISKILGHSNTNITSTVYAHVINDNNEKVGNIISEVMFK